MESKKQALRGSITIFAAMTFMLITQCVFTLLEGARMQELGKVATLNTDAEIESVFAEYCIPLWEEYHLLACDLSDEYGKVDMDRITERFEEITTSNFASGETLLGFPRINLLRLEQEKVDYDSYTMLTDCQGKVFQAAVAAYMKQNLPYEAVRKMTENYEKMKGIEANDSYDENKIGGAMTSLENARREAEEKRKAEEAEKKAEEEARKKAEEEAKRKAEEKKKEEEARKKEAEKKKTTNTKKKRNSKQGVATVMSTNSTVTEVKVDNPLEAVSAAQAKGILGLVLPSSSSVSSKSLGGKDLVSTRSRVVGKNPKAPSVSVTDKALFEQYLVGYMSDYVEGTKDHALSYELEYVLAGKKTDRENLKSVVERILLTREAANFTYLLTDITKQEEALSLATLIAGASVNPLVIEAVKLGLLTAWAFCESVLDVRALLAGEKIPLVKTRALWTSNLSAMPSLLNGFAKAKSTAAGIGYTEYLGTMIMMQSAETVAYRVMDLQELTIRKQDGYEGFRMDHTMCNMKMRVEYQHHSMFFNMVSLISEVMKPYKIRRETSYMYFKY